VGTERHDLAAPTDAKLTPSPVRRVVRAGPQQPHEPAALPQQLPAPFAWLPAAAQAGAPPAINSIPAIAMTTIPVSRK
jgi:hypothetical protein